MCYSLVELCQICLFEFIRVEGGEDHETWWGGGCRPQKCGEALVYAI
jgi:hypothetical protein